MTNFIDTVLNGSPTFKFTYNDNTTAVGVKIELETEIITLGTALNKALFDSIADDLNARLLISNKATNAEAKAGTNDTKYVTPAKVQTKLSTLLTTQTITNTTGSNKTTTLIDFSNVSGNQIITLDATVNGGTTQTSAFKFAGTGINKYIDNSIDESGTSVTLASLTGSTRTSALHIEINTYTKTFWGYSIQGGAATTTMFKGTYNTLTSLTNIKQSATSFTTQVAIHFSSQNPNA